MDADNSVIDMDNVVLDHSGKATFDFDFVNDTIFTAEYEGISISKKVKGGSFTELQGLISAADDGDTITLTKDYIYIKGIDAMTQGISIVDKHNLVIDGNGFTVNADGNSRVFAVDMQSRDIVFKNINIANGYLYSNTGGSGLVIQSDNSRLINCTFINNTADTTRGGAALSVDASHLIIDGCRFINNTQLHSTAGAIYLRGYDLTIRNTLFENNSAVGYAGAVESYDDCDIINCTFINNSAPYAGATFNYGHANIRDCTFIANRAIKGESSDARASAGAVYAADTTITNCTFICNEASDDGAAIAIASNETVIDRCIFINNTCNYNGIVYSYAKGGKIINSIFLNNNVKSFVVSCLYNGLVADYNWYGNTWKNYDNNWLTVSNLATMRNWLFLNATDFKFDDKGNLEVAFTLLEYDNITKSILHYDVDDMPQFSLKLSSQNLTLTKNVAELGETIKGTATNYKGTLTGEYENVKYEVPFKHKIESKIIVNSTINVFAESSQYVDYELIPFESDVLPFLVSSKRLTIACNDTSVAKIEAKASGYYVTGLKTGLALLTISYNGLNVMGEDRYTPANATVLINVTRIATHIGFVYDVSDMGIGETSYLYAYVYDYKNRSVSSQGLTFVNNNESVISLSDRYIKTLAEGLANITADYAGNDKYGPCSMDITFRVAKRSLEITVDKNELELFIGQYYLLGPNVVGIQSFTLNCTSNDTSVATVSEKGEVYAVGKGIANLTIRYDGNNKYAPSEVYVIVSVIDFETHIDVESEIELNITDGTSAHAVLKNTNNGTILPPTYYANQSLVTVYSSNDTSVATVDESGYINAVGVGVANVTIRFNGYMEYQASSASMIVRVTIPENRIIVRPEIDLHVGESFKLDATLEHVPFDFKGTDFKYEVNDTEVVRISQYGTLTGISNGTAKITIRYNASNKYQPCNATVIVNVDKGTVKITSPDSISLYVDESQKINANLTSLWENKNITGMKYESGNTSVAKVDRYGTVTAVGAGKVNITVMFNESNKYYGDSANVTVTVNYVPTEVNMGETFVLFVDQSDNLDAALSPAEAGSLIYQSSDESIVKVDANGTITAVGAGQTNVTAIFSGNKKYAPSSKTALVTVYPLDIPTEITVNRTIELDFNDTVNIGAVLNPSNAGDLTYESSNTSVVTVDAEGVISAVGVGEANISVNFEGVSGRFLKSNATVLVRVNPVATDIAAQDSISLAIDETATLDAVLTPSTAGSLTYLSSNSSVASVDGDGIVKAVGVGNAVITVNFEGSSNYLASSKDITVTVNQVPTEIDVGKTFALIIDENGTLDAVLSPAEAGSLIYESSDENIVKVDSNGSISAVGVGEANVTVRFDGNGRYAPASQTVLVSVSASDIPTDISVNKSIELELNNSTDIAAVLTPSNAGNLTYVSSNPNIIEVDENGVITAVGIGEANITVEFAGVSGRFLKSNATVLVKVNRIPTQITASDSITLIIDETESVNATLSPADAGSLNYLSSDESIVKVDNNGVITAVGQGTAKITVSYAGADSYLASSINISVTVNKIATQIDVGKTFVLFIDGTADVNASLSPADAGNLTYESGNESIVKVDNNGIITAVGVGQAVVTVSFNATDKYASSSEKVTVTVKSVDIATSISVNDEFDLYVGNQTDIAAVLNPSNAGDLTYESSDESVVKVDNNGIITAVGVGQANVTVKFAGVNGKFLKSQATALVKVSAIPTEMTAESPLTINLTENATVKYDFSHPEAGNVEFIIENPQIISISNGVITANKVGKTNVTILFRGNENYTASNATIQVIVVDVETAIEACDLSVNVTETARINAVLTPNVGKLTYESTNSSIVSVDADGIVTGIGVGEADIIIKFEACGKYRESSKVIHLTVVDVPTAIEAADVNVNLTERAQIGAKLTPSVGKLTYESSNSSVASVDANGVVTGIAIGEANITIRFDGIGKYRGVNKTVTVRVTDVETTIDASDVAVNVTETGKIDAKLTPNVGKLSYESTNTSIVTVDKYGTIKGVSIGQADIIIRFEAAGKYRQATKTVHVNVVGVPTEIMLNNTLSLFVDQTANLNAVLTPKTLGKLTYESSNSSVASVDANGRITANRQGTAVITVSYAGEGKYLASNATVKVTVSRIATEILLDPVELELGEGKTLRPRLSPGGSGQFIYTSNDTSVVLVEGEFISAVSEGTALITIAYPGDEKYLSSNMSFVLTVEARKTSIDVEKDIEIGFGESMDLNARVVTMYYPTDLPLTYASSDSSIVSVDENGKITAHKIGNATIFIEFAGESSFAPSNATVNVVVTTKTTEIKVASDRMSVYVDDETIIDASLIGGPQNAKLTYQSSNPGIVRVDSSGKIMANGVGSAVIKISYAGDSEYHSSSADVNVTVSKIQTKIVADNTFEMKVFETIDLNAVLTPQNAVMTYSSADSEIASVDASGKVTAKSTGSVVVTIKYAGDRKYLPSQKQVIVTVSKVPTSINLTDITIYSGQELRLENILNPSEAPSRYLTFDSGDLEVFDVSSKGVITTYQEGTADLFVAFRGTDAYLASNITVTVNVVKKKLTSDECVFAIDVSDDAGEAAFTLNVPKDAGGNFIVTVDGETFGDEDNIQDGVAVINVDELLPGDHKVTMRYTGDQKYFAVNNQTTIHIYRIKIDKNKDVSVVYTENPVYKVHLTRDTQAMENRTVTFKVNGKTYYGVTDIFGYASVKLPKLPIKTYTITASYKGIKVTNKITSKHIIVAKNMNAKKSKALKVKVTLNKVNKKYLSNKKVTLKFRGKTYTAKTNKKGVVTFTIPKSAFSKLKVGKSYTYKVTYSKDSLSKKIKIVK